MNHVAESFSFPFRPGWRRSWPLGSVLVALWPLAFIPLLGYSIATLRTVAADPASGPPPWRWSQRLLTDGAWTALAVAVVSAPFALLWWPISSLVARLLARTGIGPTDPLLARAWALDIAGFVVLLPWIGLLLILMPAAAARFAVSGKAGDLFDFRTSLATDRSHVGEWNLAVAAVVTAWILGLACAGLLCVGAVPGVFYAILVSSHATATLIPPGARPAGVVATDPAPG